MSAEHKRKIRKGVKKYHDCAKKAGCGNKPKSGKVRVFTRKDLEKRVLALKKARARLQKNERPRPPPTKPKKKAPLKIKKKVGPPTKPKKKSN